MAQEEIYWKQRAKAFWLRDGDANTKCFHLTATASKRRKIIDKLKNDNNEWVGGQSGLCELAKDYFGNLFLEQQSIYSPVIEAVSPIVSVEDNQGLELPFTGEEFRVAIFQMHPDKSPGPDGLNPVFY